MLVVRHASIDGDTREEGPQRLLLGPLDTPVCCNCMEVVDRLGDYRVDTYRDSIYRSYLCEDCLLELPVPDDANVVWRE